MAPSDRHALFVKAGGDPVVVVGTILVMLDVFFPRPYNFHRAIDLLSDLHRLGDDVHLQPSAEATAQ